MSKEAPIGFETHHPTAPPSYDQAMGQYQPALYPEVPSQDTFSETITPSMLNPARPQMQQMPQMQMQQPQQTVFQTPVIIQTMAPVGPKPVTMVCARCHNNIKTTTVRERKGTATLACVVMCMLGLWCCCCIPCCMDSCFITNHSCPNCKAFLGSYSPA